MTELNWTEKNKSLPHKVFLHHPKKTKTGLEVQAAGGLIKDIYLCSQGVRAQEQTKTSEEAS